MTEILYNLIIRPLYLFFEFVFVKAFALTGNYGYTIIALSLTINLLVFPLYRSADRMQKEEREKEERLSYWTEHIKKTFKGDERYMMLQTYYRQNGFKQTDSLKGTVSLILQIPFFIAAYRFLSGLQQLNGVSFGILHNLGKPDALLSIAGVSVNVLPILMTVINWISGTIYTRGMPIKSKIQLYSMALIFLVLLYKSPAGLVFYWTLNNLFSLCKNIFYKLKNPGKVLRIVAAVLSPLFLLVFLLTQKNPSKLKIVFAICICGSLLCPLLYEQLKNVFPKKIRSFGYQDNKKTKLLFVIGVVYMTCLVGMLIPSAVVVSSPTDFIDSTNYQNPLVYILYTLNITAGFFLVWLTVFYMLASESFKSVLVGALWVIAGVSTINYMFFAKKMGNMSAELVFDNGMSFSIQEKLINLVVASCVAVFLWVLYCKYRQLMSILYASMFLGIGVILFQNVLGTQKQLAGMTDYLQRNEREVASIPLSKKGKNVIVFMLDRSIGPYVPYLFNEKPELKELFAGFTYYRNTVSMGTTTNTGSAALFGGYEYSAYEMDRRNEESLMEKQNEALKVMPVLFAENGYHVTVCDPPYAGFKWIGDLSIYEDYPSINAYHTKGKFDHELKQSNRTTTQRNFVGYSIMKIMPLFIQHSFYDNGNYNNTDIDRPDYTEKFMDSYSVLDNLQEITPILEDETNTFFMIDNETAHEPCKLQLPDYVPAFHCDNGDYEIRNSGRFTLDGVSLKEDNDWRLYHYYVDMAAFLKLGEWFDYMRENEVYNNTRIILVSDHGFRLEQVDAYIKDGVDLMHFMPLLMVKDYNATEFTISDNFMTNADTPTIATKDLFEKAVNPFTGKAITDDTKKDDNVIVFHTEYWQITDNNGNEFIQDAGNRWYWVHDNIYDLNNWNLMTDAEVRHRRERER